jgi:hypothetical protein
MKSLRLVSLAALLLSTWWAGDAAGGQGAQSARVKVDVARLGPHP